MVIFPKSKINIGLNIVKKREDGYHDLQTIFAAIDWTDILEVVPSETGKTTLTLSGNPCDCPFEKNLVIKALRAMEKFCGSFPPVDIYLRKIVPDGAGLGGGSADAAAMAEALNSIFALGLDKRQLAEICSSIGADCPFFIYKRPMLAEGIGTNMEAIEIPGIKGLKIIVAKPPVSVSTSKAYARVKPTGCQLDFEKLSKLPIDDWHNHIYNDFENAIFEDYPQIKRLKDYFYRTGAVYASMSGSGSAVYALYRNDILADADYIRSDGTVVWTGSM